MNLEENTPPPKSTILKTGKSVGVSIILTILLGSLGLFHSTIIGGLIMSFLFFPIVLVLFLSGNFSAAIILSLLFYPICIIWGIKAVKKYNLNLFNGKEASENIEYSTYNIIQFMLLSTFVFCLMYAIVDTFTK